MASFWVGGIRKGWPKVGRNSVVLVVLSLSLVLEVKHLNLRFEFRLKFWFQTTQNPNDIGVRIGTRFRPENVKIKIGNSDSNILGAHPYSLELLHIKVRNSMISPVTWLQNHPEKYEAILQILSRLYKIMQTLVCNSNLPSLLPSLGKENGHFINFYLKQPVVYLSAITQCGLLLAFDSPTAPHRASRK